MREYNLETQLDSRKSFYGKAIIRESDTEKELISYGTKVAYIKDGQAVVNGTYSATTTRHIKDFLYQNGFGINSTKDIIKKFIKE